MQKSLPYLALAWKELKAQKITAVLILIAVIGAFEVPDRKKIPEADIIMETRKGVAVSYAPSQVAV